MSSPKNKAARAAFEAFSPSHRREYVEWIAGARGEDTRRRRLATAIAWIAEGKPRNWKYIADQDAVGRTLARLRRTRSGARGRAA